MRFSPGCQCCESGDSCADCYDNDEPSSWLINTSLSLSGNHTCVSPAVTCPCSQFVFPASVDLTTACTWVATASAWSCATAVAGSPGCPGGSNTATMSAELEHDSGTDTWVMTFTVVGGSGLCLCTGLLTVAIYTCPGASWNCTGTNEMSLDSVTGECDAGGWPATIEIESA